MDAPSNMNDHNDDDDRADVVELHDLDDVPGLDEAGHENLAGPDLDRAGGEMEPWRGDRDITATLVDGIAGASARSVVEVDDDERPPIVAPWLRSRASRRVVWRRAVARRWWWLRFHVARLHLYWARLAGRTPRGIDRLLRAWWRLTVDAEGRESIIAIRSAASPDARGNLDRAEDEHWHRIKTRLLFDAVAGAAAVAALAVWVFATPVWFKVVTLVALPVGLGALGRAEGDPPVMERVIYKGQAIEKPTADLVTRALANALVSVERAVRDNPAAVNFRQPPTTLDTGAGYRMVFELPGGVTVEDCVRVVGKIAGGLSRDAACLAVEQVPPERGGHASMAELTVLDAPMRATPPPMWPFAAPTAGPIDIFKPVPLGVDLIGRTVAIDLMFRSAVVGAQPRVGKTFTVRVMALAAALDPRTELHVFDCKGGVDFRALGVGDDPGTGVVHSGQSSLRPEVIGPEMENTVRYLLADLRRRSDVINSLPVDRCPEGKVTTELANDRSLGLHPVFVFVDETQFINDWPNAAAIWAGLTELAKAGPSYGICVLLASQQVNADTIPRSVSTMAGLRFCLSVADTNEGNLILGGGASKRGYRPDYLTLDDKGIGYLAGEGAEPRLMRSFFVDGPTAVKVAARARALRENAGRLTGHAAGELETPDNEPGIADRMAAAWPPGRGRVSYTELAGLLAASWPELFDGWDAEAVSAAGRAIGLIPVQVKRDGRNLWGYLHDDVLAATTQRGTEPDNEYGLDDDVEADDSG